MTDISTDENPLISKIGQAYQVIGTLSAGRAHVSEEEWVRALDYFADEARYDPDFLPWPRHGMRAESHTDLTNSD